MKKLVFLIFTLFLVSPVIFSQGVPPSKGLFVLPSIIDFSLSSGEVGNKTITIHNRTDLPVQLKLYLNDWYRDSTGQHVYLEPGQKQFSCANWVKLEKTFVELPVGASMPVNITMNVPENQEAATAMKWAMLFVEMAEEKRTLVDTGVNLAVIPIYRMGIHIYETPPSVTKKGIKMLQFERSSKFPDSLVYQVVTENTGDVQLRCKSTLELTNLQTGEKTTLGPDNFTIFPRTKRIMYYSMPAGLKKGKYSVLVVVDGGEELPLEAAQVQIEVQ